MAAMDDVQPELLPPSFLTSVDKCSLKMMKMAEDSFWWARWAYSHRVYHNEGQGGGWVAAAIYDICANQISVKHTLWTNDRVLWSMQSTHHRWQSMYICG